MSEEAQQRAAWGDGDGSDDDEIAGLQRRVTWLERQHRMLLIELKYYGAASRSAAICVNAACLNGPVPHMAEQPFGCPRLK